MKSTLLSTFLLLGTITPLNESVPQLTMKPTEMETSEQLSIAKVYNNVYEMGKPSLNNDVIGNVSYVVNGIPQKTSKITTTGFNVVETLYDGLLSGKDYQDVEVIVINKTPQEKYDNSTFSVRLGESITVPISKFFIDEEGDDIHITASDNPYVKIVQKGDEVELTGLKEVEHDSIKLQSQDKYGDGDEVHMLFRVFTSKPEGELIDLTSDKELEDLSDLLLGDSTIYLLDNAQKLSLQLELSDEDGGDLEINVSDSTGYVHSKTVENVSKDYKEPTTVTVDYPLTDNKRVSSLEVTVTDNNGHTVKILGLPDYLNYKGNSYQEFRTLLTDYYGEIGEDEYLSSSSINKFYEIVDTLDKMNKGKGILYELLYKTISSLDEGTVRSDLLGQFFTTLQRWAVKSDGLFFKEDLDLLNIHYGNDDLLLKGSFAVQRYKEDLEQTNDFEYGHIQQLMLLERDILLLEEGYDHIKYLQAMQQVGGLTNSSVKDEYVERLQTVRDDVTLDNYFLMTKQDVVDFSSYQTSEIPFDESNTDLYLLSLAEKVAINKELPVDEQKDLGIVLVQTYDQTSESLAMIENYKYNATQLTNEQIGFMKEYLKNNEMVDILRYINLLRKYEDGRKVNYSELAKDGGVYYVKSNQELYARELENLGGVFTYKELLLNLTMLNMYNHALSKEDKTGASQDLLRNISHTHKYNLINNLNKESLRKFNNDVNYRTKYNYRNYGIMTYLEDYKTQYNQLANTLIKENIKIDVQLLHLLVLVTNDTIPKLDNNVVFHEKEFPEKEVETVIVKYVDEVGLTHNTDKVVGIMIDHFKEKYQLGKKRNKEIRTILQAKNMNTICPFERRDMLFN